jgi:hypothetical protein
MMTRTTIFILLFSFTANIYGQTDDSFKAYGRPVFVNFSNVHYSFNKDGGSPAFEISRVYLGYEHFFSKAVSAKAVFDIGDPGVGGLQMAAYVKNAFMLYKGDKFSGRIGMIGTDAFSLSEKHWGHRYIMKTLQDEYGFSPSADIGAAIEYVPSKFISLDLSVLNGEGYKKLQSDSVFKYSAGVTLKPADGLSLRVYTDFMKKDYLQNTLSFYAGYTHEKINVGIEFAMQANNKMSKNHDFSGLSTFGSLKLSERFSLIARYDYLWSETIDADGDPWNYNNDGQLFIAGFDFAPVKGIRIAPVYIGRLPADKSKTFTSAPGVYFEVKL